MRPKKLSDGEVQSSLELIDGWDLANGEISKTFQFDSFIKGMEFVNILAETAENIQHHPDIDIRYNKIKVALSTHDVGGLTELDFSFAGVADGYADAAISH